MDIVIAWYWLIKLTIIGITSYAIYVAIAKHRLKSKKFNVIALILITLSFLNPIKIDGTNSHNILRQQSAIIENTKVLPEKVVDNSFDNAVKTNTVDVTHEQIWK